MNDASADNVIPEHESPVRRITADEQGQPFVAYRSLAEAQQDRDGAVILEGDYGGIIYATCPARLVKCDEAALNQLLYDLDQAVFASLDSARVYFERLPANSGVWGGMGGGVLIDGVWVHPRLEKLVPTAEVAGVFRSTIPRIESRYMQVWAVAYVDAEKFRRRFDEVDDRWWYAGQFHIVKIVQGREVAQKEALDLQLGDPDRTHVYFVSEGPLRLPD